MTVEQFKEKYDALQKEGNDIYAQMKPLLKRLKTLAKRGLRLAEMVKIPLPTNKTSVGTIAIPEEVVKRLPPMDM